MFSGFVEGHFLIKNPLDGPHHGLKAMHPESEGFVRLVVSLLLLKKKKEKKKQKACRLRESQQRKGDKKKEDKPGSGTPVAHPPC